MDTLRSTALPRALGAGLAALLAAAAAAPAAQGQQADRHAVDVLRRAYPEAVVQRVGRLLEGAEDAAYPRRALAEKALEGAAKRVPGDRLVEALDRRRTGLERAAEALGGAADPASVKAGAAALDAGVRPDGVRRLGDVAPRADRPAALVVLGELHGLGVPVDPAVEAVSAALERDGGAAGAWALAARVRTAVRRGADPREGLEEVAGPGVLPPTALPGALPGAPGALPGPPVPPGTGPPDAGAPSAPGVPGDEPPDGPPVDRGG